MPRGALHLAGADLHPHVASSAHDVPLPLGGLEGAQPPASPCRGPREAWPQRVGWLTGAKTAGLADLGRRVDLVERSDPRGEGDPALARALKRDTEGDWD